MGLVGPSDVKELQTRVHDYRASLQASIDQAAGTASALPLTGPWSIAQWADLAGRCEQFESEGESTLNPLNWLYAGSAYDRGRGLIDELDKWRDQLSKQNAPNVPAPVPVPKSDLGLAGGLGLTGGLIALGLIFLLASKTSR